MELYKSVILDVMEKGKLNSIPQNPEEGIYISRKKMIEMMLLDREHLEDEKDLDLKIKAFWFPPHDGAGFVINGKYYTLINGEILRSLQTSDSTAITASNASVLK